MPGNEPVLKDVVQRVLHAGKGFRGVIVLVVNVEVSVFHGLPGFGREQVVVDKRLGGLRRELHHHSRWRVGVHIGVLAGDVVVFGLDDFQEYVAGLGPAGYTALVTVGDISLGHLLSG